MAVTSSICVIGQEAAGECPRAQAKALSSPSPGGPGEDDVMTAAGGYLERALRASCPSHPRDRGRAAAEQSAVAYEYTEVASPSHVAEVPRAMPARRRRLLGEQGFVGVLRRNEIILTPCRLAASTCGRTPRTARRRAVERELTDKQHIFGEARAGRRRR